MNDSDITEIRFAAGRALTKDEQQRIFDAAAGAFAAIEWERTQPVHRCERDDHGQLVYRHAAVCLQGCNLGELTGRTEQDATDAMRKAIVEHGRKAAHEIIPASDAEGPFWGEQPACHDCRRVLIRPAGLGSPEAWVCPAVHRHAEAERLQAGEILECGGAA